MGLFHPSLYAIRDNDRSSLSQVFGCREYFNRFMAMQRVPPFGICFNPHNRGECRGEAVKVNLSHHFQVD